MVGASPTPTPVIDAQGVQGVSVHDGWLFFGNEYHRDLALVVLVGRWTYLWWSMFGDGFNVTRSLLAAVPCDIEKLGAAPSCDMEAKSLVAELLSLTQVLKKQMPEHLTWEKKKGQRVGRYNFRKLRHITDEADWLLAQAWGLTREQYEAAGNLRDRMTFGSRA
ncbi:MAG: hypothetical protein OXH26_05720, partial [bacterium]|nr:hypothetical protein [bacterium]